MDVDLVARFGAITNLTHGFIYFSPDAAEEYRAVGLDDAHHYFASRGAAFGPVPASVIVATFFNFRPSAVEAVIPAAWAAAEPFDIQQARMRAAGRVLARVGGDVDATDLDAVIEIAGRMCDGVGYEGRPLAAANRAVTEPDDRWERLWQRITVIREWRGDAHVAALTAAPVTAVEALVLHAATGQVPSAALLSTRRWSDEEWAAGIEGLAGRGLVEADGSFTPTGAAFREDIEDRTNVASAAMLDAVGEQDARRMIDLLKPIRSGLIDSGAFAALGR